MGCSACKDISDSHDLLTDFTSLPFHFSRSASVSYPTIFLSRLWYVYQVWLKLLQVFHNYANTSVHTYFLCIKFLKSFSLQFFFRQFSGKSQGTGYLRISSNIYNERQKSFYLDSKNFENKFSQISWPLFRFPLLLLIPLPRYYYLLYYSVKIRDSARISSKRSEKLKFGRVSRISTNF